jgi:hypothetical protein
LERAIADVKTLYAKISRIAVAPEAAVQAWGYKGLSGVARTRLAALNQYGLVEYGGNRVKVTDRGLTFALRTPDSNEWLHAAREAALEPDIFRELYGTYGDMSDDQLRYHLIRDRNFTDEGASKLIASFRSSLAFAKLDTGSYDDAEDEGFSGGDDEFVLEHRRKRQEKGDNVQTFSWPLSGSLQAEVTLSGRKATADDIDMLKDYLDVAKRALKREGASSSQSDEPAE